MIFLRRSAVTDCNSDMSGVQKWPKMASEEIDYVYK